nr:hypothetical protein Iba_chr15bCG11330 [Ipomoea batatas]
MPSNEFNSSGRASSWEEDGCMEWRVDKGAPSIADHKGNDLRAGELDQNLHHISPCEANNGIETDTGLLVNVLIYSWLLFTVFQSFSAGDKNLNGGRDELAWLGVDLGSGEKRAEEGRGAWTVFMASLREPGLVRSTSIRSTSSRPPVKRSIRWAGSTVPARARPMKRSEKSLFRSGTIVVLHQSCGELQAELDPGLVFLHGEMKIHNEEAKPSDPPRRRIEESQP